MVITILVATHIVETGIMASNVLIGSGARNWNQTAVPSVITVGDGPAKHPLKPAPQNVSNNFSGQYSGWLRTVPWMGYCWKLARIPISSKVISKSSKLARNNPALEWPEYYLKVQTSTSKSLYPYYFPMFQDKVRVYKKEINLRVMFFYLS